MRIILSLAGAGVKQIRRQKLFSAMVFFFIIYLGFCLFLGQLSAGHAAKVMRDMGLAGVEISLIVLAVFSLSLNVARDKSGHILDVYLLNMSRPAYLAARLLSYIAAAFLYLVLSGAALSLLLFCYHAFHPAVLAALYSIFLKASLMVAVSCLLAFVFSSPLLTMSAALFVYIAAELLPSAQQIASRGPSGQRLVIDILYIIFPNFYNIDFRYQAVWGILPSLAQICQITIYSLAYLICLYLLNVIIFARQEL